MSRNGLACKAGRVKCDGIKLGYQDCQKSTSTCKWERKSPQSQCIILPRNITPLSGPAYSLQFLDQREASYFELYHEETAFEILGCRKSIAWTTLIPQICHTKLFVLQTVVAIRALSWSVKTTSSTLREPSSIVAISQQANTENLPRPYTLKAIVGMRQS
ncbi:hypothetical protein BGZ60DRAFT_528574 [Tricladium varicosporioides]|nr:hypothetical protein BGZ60DRAFT_528574 [Hymenoscyphus varicosporioides]